MNDQTPAPNFGRTATHSRLFGQQLRSIDDGVNEWIGGVEADVLGDVGSGVVTNSLSIVISCHGPVVRTRNEPASTKFTLCPAARARSGSCCDTRGVRSKRSSATGPVWTCRATRFIGSTCWHIRSDPGASWLGDVSRHGAAPISPRGSLGASDAGATIENPLLRSGIALAGANLGHDIRGDGILTALEASGLNLSGTKLVTLSACDTGVGEVRNGEGVYGLRRSFLLAGTETLVMSLWPLSDYMARETMVTYYAGLRNGSPGARHCDKRSSR